MLLLLATSLAWPQGNEQCPCINPFDSNSSDPCNTVRQSDGRCFSASFGAEGCKAYDALETPECLDADEMPRWCSSKWCYVDVNNCNRTTWKSQFFPNNDLFYSYGTCGYIDYYSLSSRRAAEFLRAHTNTYGKLRVAFPHVDSSSGYTLVGLTPYDDGRPKVTPGTGVGGTNRSGSVPVFMDRLLASERIPWEEIPVSKRSREYSPNSGYTACVHEVAIGNVDMCWANFWPTAARRLLSSFSGALYYDHFIAVTLITSGTSGFWDSLSKPFSPFSVGLWALIFGVFGFVGLVLMAKEEVDVGDGATKRRRTMFELVPLVFIPLFKGMHVLNTGEVKGVYVKSSGGWLSQFLVGFTRSIVIAVYTSLTVSSLLVEGRTAITSIDDGISKRATFCVNSDVRALVVEQFPGLANLFVDKSNLDVLEGVLLGECQAALVSENDWFKARAFGATEYCDAMTALPGTVTIVSNTVPIRQKLASAMSALIERDTEAGKYIEAQTEAKLNYTGQVCKDVGVWQTKQQFSASDLAAPLCFVVVGVLVGLLIDYIGSRYVDTAAQKIATVVDVHGDCSFHEVGKVASEHLKSNCRDVASCLSASSRRVSQLGHEVIPRVQLRRVANPSRSSPSSRAMPTDDDDCLSASSRLPFPSD